MSYTQNTVEFDIVTGVGISSYKLELEEDKNGRGYKYTLTKGNPIIVNQRKESKDIIDLFLNIRLLYGFRIIQKCTMIYFFCSTTNLQFSIQRKYLHTIGTVLISQRSHKKD